MASIRREIPIDISPDALWDALKDVGSLHTRLVKGFVTDCRLEGNARIVTFANGVIAMKQSMENGRRPLPRLRVILRLDLASDNVRSEAPTGIA